MSSNINTKNLIFSFNKYDNMPYQHSQMIDYSVNNTHVNSTTLDNTFAQCVDNDMYIAKQLLAQQAGKQKDCGPLLVSSKKQIDDLPNGAKFFSDSGDARIMQKSVKSLGETIIRTANSHFANVNIIKKIGMYSALVCTNDASYIVFVNDIDKGVEDSKKTSIVLPEHKILDEYGYDVVVSSVLVDEILPFVVVAGQSNGSYNLYWLDMPNQDSAEGCVLKVLKRLDNNQPIRHMSCSYSAQYASNLAIAAATDSNVFLYVLQDKSIISEKNLYSFSTSIGTGTITAIKAFENRLIVFTSNGNIYKIDYDSHSIGFRNASIVSLSSTDITIYDIIEANGNIFAATSDGPYVISNDFLQRLSSSYSKATYNFAIDSHGIIWCGDSSGRILKIDPAILSISLHKQTSYPSIDALYVINDVKFIIASQHLYYEKSYGKFEPVFAGDAGISKMIVAQSSNGSASIYTAHRSDSKVKLIKNEINIVDSGVDYDAIDGLSSSIQLAENETVFKMVKIMPVGADEYLFFALVNDTESSYVLNIKTKQRFASYNGQIIKGMIKGPHGLYVITTQAIYRYGSNSTNDNKFELISSTSSKNSFTTPLFNSVVVSYQLYENTSIYLATLSSNTGCQIAKITATANKNLLEVDPTMFQLGMQSNICKYIDGLDSNNDPTGTHYVVMQKNSTGVRKVASYDLANQMQDASIDNSLTGIYYTKDCKIVDNFCIKAATMPVYRRADYIIPEDNTSKLSVINAFLLYDVEEDEISLRNQKIEELNVTGIKSMSFTDDGDKAMCYVKNNVAKYVFAENLNQKRICDPKWIFENTNQSTSLTRNDITLACIEQAQYSSGATAFSAIEMHDNKPVNTNYFDSETTTIPSTYYVIHVSPNTTYTFSFNFSGTSSNASYIILEHDNDKKVCRTHTNNTTYTSYSTTTTDNTNYVQFGFVNASYGTDAVFSNIEFKEDGSDVNLFSYSNFQTSTSAKSLNGSVKINGQTLTLQNNIIQRYDYSNKTITAIGFAANSWKPIKMCSASGVAYILMQNKTDSNKFQVYYTNPSQSTLNSLLNFTSTSHDNICMFISYDRADDVNYDDSSNVAQPFPDNTFDADDGAISKYIDPIDTTNGGNAYLHVIMDNNGWQYNTSTKSLTNTSSWINATAKFAFATSQVKDNRCNAMFAINAFGNQTDETLYKIDGKNEYYVLNQNKILYNTNWRVPSELADVYWIGKDNDLQASIGSDTAKKWYEYFTYAKKTADAVEVHIIDFTQSGTNRDTRITIQSQQEIDDIHIARYAKKYFYDNKCIIYSLQEQILIANASQTTSIGSISAGNSIKVLDGGINTNDIPASPIIAYENSIKTLDFASKNTVTPDTSKRIEKTINGSYEIDAFAIDASNYKQIDIALKPSQTILASDSQKINVLSTSMYDAVTPALILDANAKHMIYPDNCTRSTASPYALMQNDNVLSIYNTIDNDLTAITDASQLASTVANSTIRCVKYSFSDEKYNVYGSTSLNGAFQLKFTDIGNVNDVTKMTSTDDAIVNVLPFDKSYCILQSKSRFYKYNGNGNAYLIYASPNEIAFSESQQTYGAYMYFAGQGNNIISSDDASVWSNVIQNFGLPDYDAIGFALLNQYVSLESNSNGQLYCTKQKYSIVANTTEFTAESAFYAYEEYAQEFDTSCDTALQKHIRDYHNAKSPITLMNNYMDTSFQISNFMQRQSFSNVSNDYIDQILVGDASNENIVAFASNTANSEQWKQINCSYIAKCWKSGLTEIYIYLPTTFTHYIPHIEGASQCNSYNEQVVVNGRNLTSNIYENVTSVMVDIDKSLFSIDALLENTIKGCSLPLRIFKENDSTCRGSNMFHSFICPSVAADHSINDVFLGYYQMKYFCFGSDAQSIKLSFINSDPKYNKKYKTIIYHTNGGSIPKMPGMKTIKQHIYEDNEGSNALRIYWDIFEKEGAFFVGWSPSQNAFEGDDAYSEGTTLAYSSIKAVSIDLYACWITYNFSSNDTQIEIANTTPETYTIAEISIDPNANIPDNPTLGNKFIVNYGE